jgi:hypothetical protein
MFLYHKYPDTLYLALTSLSCTVLATKENSSLPVELAFYEGKNENSEKLMI